MTANGRLDPSFGTSGEFAIPRADGYFYTVAVQTDGKIVAAGIVSGATATFGDSAVAVIRLTTAGTLDASFNQTGQQEVILPDSLSVIAYITTQAVAITPSGKILVAADVTLLAGISTRFASTQVVQLNTDGTIDTTFGSGGIATTAPSGFTLAGDMAVQADGKIVLVGGTGTDASPGVSSVFRFAANGLIDPTFQLL